MVALVTDPAGEIDRAREELKSAKANHTEEREHYLAVRRAIFAPMMITVTLLNLAIFVVVVAMIFAGPERVLGLVFREVSVQYTPVDRAILSVIAFVQLLLLIQKMVKPVWKGAREYRDC